MRERAARLQKFGRSLHSIERRVQRMRQRGWEMAGRPPRLPTKGP
jgi:hypothetical protein